MITYELVSYDSFFFSSRRRHTRCLSDWSSDVCSSDLRTARARGAAETRRARAGGRREGTARCGRAGAEARGQAQTGSALTAEAEAQRACAGDRKSVV